MFKRHLELKIVKTTNPSNDTTVKTPELSKEDLKHIAKDLTKTLAITTVAVIGVSVTLNTLSQIAVIAAKSHFNSNT